MSGADIAVPLIDISPFLDGSNRAGVVAEVANACKRCGFFMIKGHGVDEGLIAEAWAAVRAFFDQPLDLKMETPMSPSYPYGYSPMSSEKAGNEKNDGVGYDTSDLKEAFQICLSSEAKPAAGLPEPLWPRAPANFKAAYTSYYRAMEGLAAQLLRIFALALDLPENWFEDKADSHWCSLRSLNYPDLAVPPNPGQLRIAAHSDYGTLTILRADNAPGGLQLLMKDGSWSDVVIPEGCFTINLGDLMARWTNDMWRSTVHRVVTPPVGLEGCRRQSMAFFHNINKDVIVEAIPSCVTAENPAKYPPIEAFAHLMERHARATGAAKAFDGANKA